MMGKAARKGYIQGFMTQVYPEDTLIFLNHDLNAACHLKWIMVCFEHILGMKINYHKSYLTPMNMDDNEIQLYAKNFCCKVGAFPFKYLGVPFIMRN
jgi:hypothetical protein